MKVRISFLINVNDQTRRAINFYNGENGLATRNDIKDFYVVHSAYFTFDEYWDALDKSHKCFSQEEFDFAKAKGWQV